MSCRLPAPLALPGLIALAAPVHLSLCARAGWAKPEVLFVDDSEDHVAGCADICQTVHVVGNGMSPADFEAIRRFAGLPAVEAAAGSAW